MILDGAVLAGQGETRDSALGEGWEAVPRQAAGSLSAGPFCHVPLTEHPLALGAFA